MINAQDEVYILSAAQEVYKVQLADCETELVTVLIDPQTNTPFVSNDIAYASDSMLYVLGGAGLFRINPQSGEITFVTPTPGVFLSVGLYGTLDGQLISVGAFGDVHIIDIATGNVNFLGNSGLTPGGDLVGFPKIGQVEIRKNLLDIPPDKIEAEVSAAGEQLIRNRFCPRRKRVHAFVCTLSLCGYA